MMNFVFDFLIVSINTQEYILLKFTFFPSVVFFLEGGVEVLPCSRGNFPEQGSNSCLLL